MDGGWVNETERDTWTQVLRGKHVPTRLDMFGDLDAADHFTPEGKEVAVKAADFLGVLPA